MKVLLLLALLLLIAWVLRRGGRPPPGDDWRRGGGRDPLPPAGPPGQARQITSQALATDEPAPRPTVSEER